jgi:aminoglycoside 3-N-acetyltransferase
MAHHIREFDVVAATRYPSTSSTIAIELEKLGVRQGDTLLVHSSLSNLGWVCGGAIGAIIGIMMAVGTQGTIVMPAHTGENSDPAQWKNPPVPEDWYKYVYLEMPAFNPITRRQEGSA